MTEKLRLQRGKENHEKQRFPNNQETLDYVATLSKEKPKEAVKAKETSHGKSR